MTALHQYSRLEAAGLWRSHPQAQRREVIVGLRHATIVLLDPKSEMPLAQWSLPAIMRVSETNGFVIFTPHEDGMETLEIDDEAMIAALDKVRASIDRRRKRPGRLRRAVTAGASLTTVAAIAIWVQLQFYDFAVKRLPDAARKEVASVTLRDISTISGSPCAGRLGLAAAQDLARRIGADGPSRIAVLREGLAQPTTLADGTILLPFDLIERAEDPDTLAGIILDEMQRAAAINPLKAALRYAGFFASARLISSGALPANAMQGYGLSLANTATTPRDTAALHGAFARLGITTAPFAQFGAHVDLAALPDPAPNGSDPIVLEDAAFLGLKYICDS